MNIYQAIKTRLSVRSYHDKPIEKDKLNRVMEAARLAPSGKNAQPWHFILVSDNALREKMIPMMRGQSFVADAPIIVVACGNEDMAYQKQGNYMNAMVIDVTCAIEHLMLAAAAEGLGTCWIGAFFEDQVKALLDVPDPWRVVALTPLGYPATEAKARPRHELGKIISIDKWDRK